MVGHATLGETEPFGGVNEGLYENLSLFRIYGSSNGADFVSVSPGEITTQPGHI